MDRTIVLIDDEEAALRTMELSLSVAGFCNIEMYTSWDDAVLGMNPAKTALLLINVAMPTVTGIDALTESRRRYPAIPVVMVTAINDVESAVNCMKHGASDCLTKPLRNEQFLECIRNVLIIDELRKLNVIEKENTLCMPEAVASTSTERLSRLEKYLNGFIDVNISKIPEESRCMFRKFSNVMYGQKIFLDPDISLDAVAEKMHTNITYLRAFIKTVFNVNFRFYVNALRIREFLILAQHEKSSTLSLEGMCRSVGFGRKATFYKAFKTMTSMTPGEFLTLLTSPRQNNEA